MIKLEKTEVVGWEAAIRGMRNPYNSWDKSDSYENYEVEYDDDLLGVEIRHPYFRVGDTDFGLMKKLANAGSTHAKYRRMIVVYVDITAPLYWWKEMDTYKVGTVANSCSTMHKIHEKEFTLEDFSTDKIIDTGEPGYENMYYDLTLTLHYDGEKQYYDPHDIFSEILIPALNLYRKRYLETKDKKYWWQMIQLLPSSYNQKRTVMLNYEVLAGIYRDRKEHKLDCWRDFCSWIKTLPYQELITGEEYERTMESD